MTLDSRATSLAPLPEPIRSAMRSQIREDMELPLFPETAARVMAACKDDTTDLQVVSNLITHDQSLAVHVLRVANSAAYAPREPVVTLHQAITRLGLGTVCEIAVAVSVKGRLFAVPGYQTRLRELWMHSAATATFAKEVATMRNLKAENLFLCGLLHDVGMPLAMQIFVDLARKHGSATVPRALLETAMFEFHRTLGGLVSQKWNLGPWIGAAMRHHHEPLNATSHKDEVLVTALADELAEWALDEKQAKDDFRSGICDALGLSPDDLERLLAKRGRVLAVTEAFN